MIEHEGAWQALLVFWQEVAVPVVHDHMLAWLDELLRNIIGVEHAISVFPHSCEQLHSCEASCSNYIKLLLLK